MSARLSHRVSRLVSSVMPSRGAVHQTSDGKKTIPRMNTALLSRMLDKTARVVMVRVTQDTDEILSAVEQ